MKLAVSSYSLSRWRRENQKSMEDCLRWLADNGIGAIEFSGLGDKAEENTVERAAEIRELCHSLGLAIAGYSVPAELLRPEGDQRKVIDRLKIDVDVAATLGVKNMRHDVTRGFGENAKGIRGAKTFATVLKVIVPAIREVAEYAQPKGVKTSLENHGFYMQNSKRVEKLIKAVKHPNYALTMDMGNFLCVNENPVNAVKRVAKYAVMVHVKDFHVKLKSERPQVGWFDTPTAIALRGAIVGHGVIDIPDQLKLLKRAKYKGYMSLEFEGLEEPTKAILWGLEYLKQQMEPLGLLDA